MKWVWMDATNIVSKRMLIVVVFYEFQGLGQRQQTPVPRREC